MILPSFPKLTGLVVTLRFLRAAEFNLHHEMAVDAFLRHSLNLGEGYSQVLSILTPENGRLTYRQHDPYRFVVIATGEPEQVNPIWHTLITHLQGLPESAPIKDPNVPLKDNVELIELHDLFDGVPLTNPQGLDAYTEQHAIDQGQAWFTHLKLAEQPATVDWVWQSTVRLLKADHKTQKTEQRFVRQASDLTPELLINRLYQTLSQLSEKFGGHIHPETAALNQAWLQQQAQFIQFKKADLYWIDTPYFGADKQANTLGGMAGTITLELLPGIEPGLLSLMVLGQMVGIGQRRTSGLGKYRLSLPKTPSLMRSLYPIAVHRGQSLLEFALQPDHIQRAVHETEQKPTIDKLTDKTHAQIQSAIGQLKKGDYNPPALQGFTIPKKDGSERLLAVSPLYDRIIQKAVAIALTPGLDAMMSQGSYGYRKGLSRQQVRYEIQNAYRQGYRWVYESDIESFFDSVNRDQLIKRLQALFGADALWPVLADWLGQDTHYKNTVIKRPKGLPQGSPLSPLLANFILDDFDSDLETHGFKILRFADDFIILCKTQHEAQLAAEAVKFSLQDVGLTLNADKTHIVELSQGFQFLGYLFREDHAIEIGGSQADGRNSFGATQAPKNLPAWLVNLGDQAAQTIDDEDAPKNQVGEIEEQGTHLILAGDAQVLTTDNHNLIVKKDEIITHKLSWEQLHAITLIGLHHMTLPAQHTALSHRIPVYYADRTGSFLGALTSFRPAQANYKHWFIQLQMSDNADFALQTAQSIVCSRIHNQRKTLLRRKGNRKQFDVALKQLAQLQAKAQRATHFNSLNGYEGGATKLYFQQINALLPEWAQFDKRSRRPPKDPFNVLLSLGYTVLYSHVDAILQSAGFMTWKGVYHQQSAAHAALASDIMESYRHLVERHAIQVVNHATIKQDDFREETNALGATGLRLSAEARRRYVAGLIRRFQGFSKDQTLHQHLYQQALELKKAMLNRTPFNAWKETK
jgi:group II intron reverse transcriptase/maturase/CRISPR-associated endonuclease Cas1